MTRSLPTNRIHDSLDTALARKRVVFWFDPEAEWSSEFESHPPQRPPVAILWTDPRSEWKPLIPLLRQQLPELLCLGDYDPEHGQGPALWLRCAAIKGASQVPVPTAKPIDDGAARLLVEDDELEGVVVVAVLISPDGRFVAQRRTVVGGEA